MICVINSVNDAYAFPFFAWCVALHKALGIKKDGAARVGAGWGK